MISKNILLVCSLLVISPNAFSWGKTGHRVVAEIAQRNLNSEAKKGIKDLLGDEDLARVANYPDEIRSDRKYDYTGSWHYVSIPTDKTYFDQKRNKDGDVIETLFRMDETLRDSKKSKEEKAFALKFMVHLMGDVHQPLHVGLAEDRGGNNVRVKWFKDPSNLHEIWDEKIIDFQQLSYTEYTTFLNHYSKAEKTDLIKGTFMDWAKESQELRSVVYDTGGSENLSYEYNFKSKPVIEERLRKAGIRLASVLNNIFKKSKEDKSLIELKQKIKDNI